MAIFKNNAKAIKTYQSKNDEKCLFFTLLICYSFWNNTPYRVYRTQTVICDNELKDVW